MNTKKISLQLLSLFSILAIIINCSSPITDDQLTATTSFNSTNHVISGYAKDVTTGEILKSYSITAETGQTTYTGTVDPSTGKYKFEGIPLEADFIIRVTANGYNNFKSTNNASLTNGLARSTDVQIDLFDIPLIPNGVVGPDLNINVYDKNSGTPITTGFFKVIRSGSALSQTIDSGLTLNQDANIYFGDLSKSNIVSSSEIIPAYQYSIEVYGVAGYVSTSTFFYVSSSTSIGTEGIDIALTPTSNSSTLSLLTHSLSDSNNNLVTLPIDRKIKFYFDQPITLDPQWNRVDNTGLTSSGNFLPGTNFITTISTSNNDGDSNSNTLNTSDNVTSAATTWVTAQVTSSTILEVTLAPDTDLLSSIDIQDDLTYTLNLSNVNIKRANVSGESAWQTPLGSYQVLIRDNSNN